MRALVILLITLLTVIPLNSRGSEEVERIIFIKDSVKESEESRGYRLLSAEVESLLAKMDADGNIRYLQSESWAAYGELLEDMSDKSALGTFYLKSGINGILLIDKVEEGERELLVNFTLYRITGGEEVKESFLIKKDELLPTLSEMTDGLERLLLGLYPPQTQEKLRSYMNRQREIVANSPSHEFFIGGGSGYHGLSVSGKEDMSGFSLYCSLGGKINKLSLSASLDFAPLFHHYPSANSVIGHSFIVNGDIGGYLYGGMFRLAGGVGYMNGSLYYKLSHFQLYPGESSYVVYRLRTVYNMLLFYFSFLVQPKSLFQIRIDIGSFFAPVNPAELGIGVYFPVFIKYNFRFFVYKGLYCELGVPVIQFSAPSLNVISRNGQNNLILHTVINIGVGWRFEWRK